MPTPPSVLPRIGAAQMSHCPVFKSWLQCVDELSDLERFLEALKNLSSKSDINI